MTTIDEAIQRVRELKRSVGIRIAGLQQELAGYEGELRGLEHAKDLLFWSEQAEKPGRLDVQGPVMAALSDGLSWAEEGIIAKTGLPAAAVHKYLLRALRDGKLVYRNEMYALPALKLSPNPSRSEAAE